MVLLGALLVGGCAIGKSVSETPKSEVALAPGKARIAVYRIGLAGFAVQPAGSVDGRKTGSCAPNGVFYVDVRPGAHEVSATTEVTETISVKARANRVTYVGCSINIGILVGRQHLVEVVSGTAKLKVSKLVYGGKY